jgi:hypothetical protein
VRSNRTSRTQTFFNRLIILVAFLLRHFNSFVFGIAARRNKKDAELEIDPEEVYRLYLIPLINIIST